MFTRVLSPLFILALALLTGCSAGSGGSLTSGDVADRITHDLEARDRQAAPDYFGPRPVAMVYVAEKPRFVRPEGSQVGGSVWTEVWTLRRNLTLYEYTIRLHNVDGGTQYDVVASADSSKNLPPRTPTPTTYTRFPGWPAP